MVSLRSTRLLSIKYLEYSVVVDNLPSLKPFCCKGHVCAEAQNKLEVTTDRLLAQRSKTKKQLTFAWFNQNHAQDHGRGGYSTYQIQQSKQQREKCTHLQILKYTQNLTLKKPSKFIPIQEDIQTFIHFILRPRLSLHAYTYMLLLLQKARNMIGNNIHCCIFIHLFTLEICL